MCNKCAEIDRTIAHFKYSQKTTDDKLALTLIAEVIAELEAEKTALHPPEQK